MGRYAPELQQHLFWMAVFSVMLFIPLASARTLDVRDGDDTCKEMLDHWLRDSGLPSGPPCMIPGNADFYGLGVRLGIYLTWISSWIANNFVAGEMAGSLDTNSIFLFALALCFIILSSMEGIYLIDNLILVQLSLGYIFGVMTLWGNRTRFYKKRDAAGAPHFGGWGTHVRLILCLAASCYSLWFWTIAVVNPEPSCYLRSECGGLRLGLFGSSAAGGSIRYGNAAFSAGCCAYYGCMALIAIVSFVRHAVRKFAGQHEPEWIPQELSEGDTRELTLFHIVVSAFNILWIIFTIVCVEFTLVYNHVLGVLAGDGLASAGQLLPLLIGLFSTGRLCWIIYKDNRDKRRATPGEESPQHVEVHKEKTRPIRQLKRGISFQRRKKEGVLWHSLLTGWMPWLNCFPAWQKLGPQPQPELRREVVTASPDVENQTYQVVTKS